MKMPRVPTWGLGGGAAVLPLAYSRLGEPAGASTGLDGRRCNAAASASFHTNLVKTLVHRGENGLYCKRHRWLAWLDD